MSFTEQDILKALSNVEDPDLKRDIVSLGMVKDLKLEGEKVSFTVELTTPACPLKEMLHTACVNAVHLLVDKNLEVNVNMSHNVTSRRIDAKEIMPNVSNIIAVASGKGGVGKSTVAVNLALALAKLGSRVGIVDADIYGPSLPTMLGLENAKPKVQHVGDKNVLIPLEKFGMKVLSIGILVDMSQAIVWRGPMASKALRELVCEPEWGELDYVIVDMPPGTGDIHLTLVQTVPVTGAIVVTTPQTVALADARRGVAMFQQKQINVPVLGIVENMSYFVSDDKSDEKQFIFGKDGGKNLAEEMNVPLLGQIPLIQNIREGGDAGKPVVLDENSLAGKSFMELAGKVAQQVSIRNAEREPTKKVEILYR